MRSNTLHKYNISKERALALDELLPDRSNQYDGSPGVYVRSDKDRELDILWQDYRTGHKEEKTARIYLITGFAAGIICTLAVSFLMNLGNPSKETAADLKLWKKSETESNVNIAPSVLDESVNQVKTTEYFVRNGDNLGAISYKFYGSVHPSKIAKIKSVNNLRNSDSLQINQKLIIPLED